MNFLDITRMHSGRMRTAHSLTVSPYLVVSNTCPPGSNHACPPRATMHAPLEQPRMPPQSNHACPLPGATTHPPRATMHASPEQPCPLAATMHAPSPGNNHPRPPMSNHACPLPLWTDRHL